ncbi:TPA: YopX family protein [Streptococcus pneumoniae]
MIPRYRAWLKKEQKMDNYIDHISWLEDELYCIGDGITYMVSAEDLVLMQSTGLFDEKGVEIFEGDILDYKGRKALVRWHGSYASFIYRFVDELQNRNTEWKPLYLAYMKCEIIGNIYENPELLEDIKCTQK